MIWRACERVGILPPSVVDSWDQCNVDIQARIVAYSQIREYEDFELVKAQSGQH